MHVIYLRDLDQVLQASKNPTNKKVTKDISSKNVDQTLHKSMISSLLYLTASKTDICFSVIVCARYQPNPKESHLENAKESSMYQELVIMEFGLQLTLHARLVSTNIQIGLETKMIENTHLEVVFYIGNNLGS